MKAFRAASALLAPLGALEDAVGVNIALEAIQKGPPGSRGVGLALGQLGVGSNLDAQYLVQVVEPTLRKA